MFETVFADARHSMRRLANQRAYAPVAIFTLALGIGGTASTYGIARQLLLDPLPFANAPEVGIFWKKTDWTEEEYLFIRGRVPGFQQVALYRLRDATVRAGDGPARLVPGVTSSAELFDVLGARPLLGRGFQAGDDAPGAEPMAVLSFELWRDLGGAPSMIGSRVTLDGTARTVIGVMPRGFWFPDPSIRIWSPVTLNPQARSWNSTLVGRVAAGVDVRALSTPLEQLTAMLDERFDYPAQWDKTKDPHITPIRDDIAAGYEPAVLSTLGAMSLILLIACANVAALMLGQVEMRSVEFAVRSALGANRGRLIQPLVVEAIVIAIAAAGFGGALAWGGFAVIRNALPLGAWAESAAPDWRVFAAALTFAIVAALLVVLMPALSLYRRDPGRALGAARTAGIRSRGRLEGGLVIAEVALAVIVATGAALLARSVVKLYALDAGVRTDGVAVVDVLLGSGNRARLEQTINDLTRALGGLPGVRSVGAVQVLPLRGGGYNLGMRIEDRPDLKNLTTEYRVVTPGYLESLGMTLRQGRVFTDADRRDTQRVIVINEALAQQFFAGIDPLGRVLTDDAGPARVIGVIGNVAERRLTDAVPPVRYAAAAQMHWIDRPQSFVLRAAPGVDERSLLEPARGTIARLAPGAAVRQTNTMSLVLDKAIGPARQVVVLLLLMTAVALVLGAVGVYGVIAHFAARRRRDWAIRVALGLPGSRVIAQVVAHGALLVSAGIVVGVAGAAALTRLLSSLLYGVQEIDPVAFAAAGAALLGVGVLAALVPAWRAATVDPIVVLREP